MRNVRHRRFLEVPHLVVPVFILHVGIHRSFTTASRLAGQGWEPPRSFLDPFFKGRFSPGPLAGLSQILGSHCPPSSRLGFWWWRLLVSCFSLEAPSDLRHMRQGPARASLCITEFLGSHIPCEHPSVTLKVCAAHVPIVLVANAVATHTAVWLTRAAYVFFHWYNGYGNCMQRTSIPF